MGKRIGRIFSHDLSVPFFASTHLLRLTQLLVLPVGKKYWYNAIEKQVVENPWQKSVVLIVQIRW